MVVLEDVEHASCGPMPGLTVGVFLTPSPKQLKASVVLSGALQAGLSPVMIDYISPHAPGDKLIDKMETMAIKEVFALCPHFTG